MKNFITTGIDIGSHTIRVMVVEHSKDEGRVQSRIVGVGTSEATGIRKGYVTNMDEAVASIQRAVHEAEKSSQQKIRKAILSVGGISLEGKSGKGITAITRADKIVSDSDIGKAIDDSEKNLQTKNRKILHRIPMQYILDGQAVPGDPDGMRGIRLEVKTFFVSCLEQHIDALAEAVVRSGVDVSDVIAAPFATSLVTLSTQQKNAGCVCVDIGSETTSVCVFEDGQATSLEVLPIGSADITNDIALRFQIPLDEAESAKLGNMMMNISRQDLSDVINARLVDIFELVKKHLQSINRDKLLPAGIVITGGAAHSDEIEDLARKTLHIPAQVGSVVPRLNKQGLKDPAWFVAYGLCISGIYNPDSGAERTSAGGGLKEISRKIKALINQILP
jgi:cell division protein FtsA